jgi:hypothetical protein
MSRIQLEEAAASVSNGLNREHDDSEYELLIQFKTLDIFTKREQNQNIIFNIFEFSTIFHRNNVLMDSNIYNYVLSENIRIVSRMQYLRAKYRQ